MNDVGESVGEDGLSLKIVVIVVSVAFSSVFSEGRFNTVVSI